MSQVLFATATAPSLVSLDANFTDLYTNIGNLQAVHSATYNSEGSSNLYLKTGISAGAVGMLLGTDSAAGVAYVQSIEPNISYVTKYLSLNPNGGGVLVGTTNTTAAPANGISILSTNTGTYLNIGHANGTSPGQSYLTFNYNAVQVGSITQSGTTATLYNTTSDRRLKCNIVDAPDAGGVIDAIRVVSHDWLAAGNDRAEFAFIAQELVKVAPQAVKRGDDGTDGNPITDAWAVDPSKLVALLVRELQSLRARVAALEAR